VRYSLEGQTNVQKRAQCLNGDTMLCMVEEVPLAALIVGVPLEDINGAMRCFLGRPRKVNYCVGFEMLSGGHFGGPRQGS
jgi:hypothetical protein